MHFAKTTLVLALVLLLAGCDDDSGDARTGCDPLPVPEAATGILGPQEDGTFLGHNGRRAGGLGTSIVLDAVSQGFDTHPVEPLAFVTAYGRDGRRLQVVDYERGEVIQDIATVAPQGKAVLSVAGDRLFVPLGVNRRIATFDVGPTGTLTEGPSVEVGSRVMALHASADGTTLWAGLFTEAQLVAIDLPSLTVRKRIPIGQGAWEIVELEERGELYISDLAGAKIAVVDTRSETLVTNIDIRSSPAGLATNADGSVVWAAVSGSDFVIAIDTATRAITNHAMVAEDDLVDENGLQLPHSNPNALAWDPATNRLFATRGTDNAITVLDGDTLEVLGSLPTSWWPTDIEFGAATGTLLVSEGFGGGSDPLPAPNGERNYVNNGTLTRIDLSTLDLDDSTQLVRDNQIRSIDLYPFDCPEGTFPIPTREGQISPIEHVILVVKENKTFDSLFGDIDLPGVDAEPSLVRWTEDIIPNHRKLAREFNLADRFFLEAQESDSGHLFTTAGHLTEFTQRFFSEDAGSLGIAWPLRDPAVPDQGNVFTHLLDHGKTIRIYGEIVGMMVPAADGTMPSRFSDFRYPGGPAINYGTPDRTRAEYVVEQARTNGLADFTYMLLPNDHTEGTTVGKPTPESHVADNDDGVGILIDGISQIEELWKKTAIFVIEDDPQGSGDHVSKARSFLIVASPWARRGYVSHHQTSFLSVHATIFRILGVPPHGRQTASAAPLWDLFTEEPDFTPYTRAPRTYPEEINQPGAFAARASARMDFRSPDRNPDLGRLLGLYREMRMGLKTRDEAERALAEPMGEDDYEDLVEEAVEETTAWEESFALYQTWLAGEGYGFAADGRVVPLADQDR
jgi:DNA-binding beta-propeller fold protein YncE